MLRFSGMLFVQPELKPARSTKIHHPHVTSYDSSAVSTIAEDFGKKSIRAPGYLIMTIDTFKGYRY